MAPGLAGPRRGSPVVLPRRRPGVRPGSAQPRVDVLQRYRGPAGPRRGGAVVQVRRRSGAHPVAVQPRGDVPEWHRVPQDSTEAARWCRLADQGHAKGPYNLGAMCYSGIGVPQGSNETARLACDQDYLPARDNLDKLTTQVPAAPRARASPPRPIGRPGTTVNPRDHRQPARATRGRFPDVGLGHCETTGGWVLPNAVRGRQTTRPAGCQLHRRPH